MNAFEYAVLHAVPRVDRGERINVGVIVYCQPLDYLGAATHVDAARLRALDPGVDVGTVCAAVDAVRAFAGPNYETAVVAEEAREVLVRFDDHVSHYETAVESS